MLAILNFFNQTSLFEIPRDYNNFKKEIYRIIDLEDKYHNDIQISFQDIDEDKVIISNNADFIEFTNQIKKNKDNNLFINIIEGSNLHQLIYPNQETEIKQSTIDDNNEKDLNFSFEDLLHIDNNKVNNGEEKETQFDKNNDNDFKDNIKDDSVEAIKEQTDIVFNTTCDICRVNPIRDGTFICEQCDMNICFYCQEQFSSSHCHPLKKINYSDKNNDIKCNTNRGIIDKNINDMIVIENENKKEEMKNNTNNKSYISLLNPINYMPNALKSILNIKTNEASFLIYKARKDYDLKYISDKDLLDAINKANGDIDEALIILSYSLAD